MYLVNITLSELSQRKTQAMWYLLCVKSNKITQTDLYTKQKQSHRHRKQLYSYQRREGGGKEQIKNMGLTDTSYYTQNR